MEKRKSNPHYADWTNLFLNILTICLREKEL